MAATLTVDTPSVSLTRRQMNVVFGTVVLGMLLAALDQTIVSTALPTIVGDLGGSAHMSWVVTSYLLAQTVSTVLVGKFGDLFGRKIVFQLSVLVFILGSLLCGLANGMAMLIASRAVQGLGGGGLAVTATALIGDVIPLRERARYQGALGAVFGVTTVIGPLLGGFLTDHASWRWAFYINVPVAAVVIVLAARALPGRGSRGSARIDYLGVLFVTLGTAGLTLATSWGGTQYAWGSGVIIGLFAGSVVALVVFVLVELRAAEPILPMRLFGSRVFSVAGVLSFIVGFAMLGALTFLPSYLQFVTGATATESGVRTLPMVLGLLVTAIGSGAVVAKSGVFRPFPIAGAGVAGLGMFLLSQMDEHTSILMQSVSMLVLGAGVGLSMQVLTIVVQSTVDYADLGAATSGVTFFRTLGGSFGASVMGTVYANQLETRLPAAVARSGVPPQSVTSAVGVHRLPSPGREVIVHAYAQSLHTVFLWSIPVAAVGLFVALLLPRATIRTAERSVARGTGEGFAVPTGANPEAQLETVIGRILYSTPNVGWEVLHRAGVTLDAPAVWGLRNVYVREMLLGVPAVQGDIEDRLQMPHGVLTSFYDQLVADGHLIRSDDRLELTESGRELVVRVGDAWVQYVTEQLSERAAAAGRERPPDLEERIRASVRRIARRAMLEDESEIQAA